MARRRSLLRHLVVPLSMALLLGGIAGGTYVALSTYGDRPQAGTCVASGLGTTHRYSTEQTANAALISAMAVDRQLPPRAASIALATAYQESRLENIDHGDRDSLGLFQQRPSQGWGTPEQIMDPIYSTGAFYDALEEVPGYLDMSVNDAAQTVQRSGFPEAYADHETEGRLYASALTGRSGANLVCSLENPSGPGLPQEVRDRLSEQFPRAVDAGRLRAELSSDAALRAGAPQGTGATALVIDVGEDDPLGWAVANWAVARAADDGIVQVSYGGRSWDRSIHGEDGVWREGEDPAPGRVVVLVAG
ncbi:hypothetical protein [Brachybacterium hainanense]|uniref:Heavy metal transporter n=1 Tax=Brachybacterium hainanense TaxID=1541174 RepID=A0ABV6RFK3_9MICO